MENLETDADASPEDRFGESIDTSITKEEPVKAEAETEETEEEQESEVDSSPTDEENVDETIDAPKDSSFQKRIDELTARFRETERSAVEKDLRIKELEAKLAEVPKDEPLKTLEDFEYDNEKFASYLATEIPSRAKQAALEEIQGFKAKSDTETRQEQFRQREKEFAKQHKDYEQVVYGEVDGRRTWTASDAVAREIMLSDIGEQVAYYLASNPDIASDISKQGDRETTRRITLIENTLKTEKAKAKSKTVTDAPPKVPKIKSGDPGLEKGYRKDMSDAEFAKMRRKEIAKR